MSCFLWIFFKSCNTHNLWNSKRRYWSSSNDLRRPTWGYSGDTKRIVINSSVFYQFDYLIYHFALFSLTVTNRSSLRFSEVNLRDSSNINTPGKFQRRIITHTKIRRSRSNWTLSQQPSYCIHIMGLIINDWWFGLTHRMCGVLTYILNTKRVKVLTCGKHRYIVCEYKGLIRQSLVRIR